MKLISDVAGALTGWKGYALVAAVCFAAGGWGGWEARDLYSDRADGKRAEAQVRTVTRTVYVERAQADVTQRVGEQTATRQAETRVVTRTIVQRVPEYVTVEADRKCVLPDGFVSLHDAAAAGDATTLPESAGGAHDAPSEIACSEALRIVVENYGDYHALAAQVTGWQTWARDQQALAGSPNPSPP